MATGMTHFGRLFAAAVVFAFGSMNSAHAVPYDYQLTYVITGIGGSALPSGWEGLKDGDQFSVLLTWDSEAATRYEYLGNYTPYYFGPMTRYSIGLGGDTIASRPVENNRTLRAFWGEEWYGPRDNLYFEDSDPTFTVAGYVDEVYFLLTCPNWASLSQLPTSLACGGDLTGTLRFSSPYGEFDVTSDLIHAAQVPEPDALILVGVGLIGLSLSRRRTAT